MSGGGHLPEMADDRREPLDRVVDVLVGREPSKTEADRCRRAPASDPKIALSTWDGVADAELHADPDDTAMSLMPMSSDSPSTPVEADVQVVRQPVLDRSVDDDVHRARS